MNKSCEHIISFLDFVLIFTKSTKRTTSYFHIFATQPEAITGSIYFTIFNFKILIIVSSESIITSTKVAIRNLKIFVWSAWCPPFTDTFSKIPPLQYGQLIAQLAEFIICITLIINDLQLINLMQWGPLNFSSPFGL